MAITIKKVSSKKELKTFIRFNYELYKENPYSVPDLYDDMLNTFSPKKNAAFEFCEAEYFLAYKDNKVVGRIAGIINKRANETWNKKEVRFGWIDFLDAKYIRITRWIPLGNWDYNRVPKTKLGIKKKSVSDGLISWMISKYHAPCWMQ